jgi:hypothetical protein
MSTDPSTIKVFVNERATHVPGTATVREAVATADPDLVSSLERGRAYVTDGVGRKIVDSESVTAGAIYRVVVSARQAEDPPTTA